MTTTAMINNTRANATSGLENIEYKTREEHATLNRDDFMKLFVTQLQYQDPMNPMESAEMASQVAQFNMVDLMYKNNTALQNMAKAEQTATSVTAIGLLGHKVEYQGSKVFVSEDGVQPFHITNEQDIQATRCKVSIYSPKGALVQKLDMGPIDPGQDVSLDWDGKDASGNNMPPGAYSVVIEAEDASGNEIELKTRTMGMVSGIETGENGLPRIKILGDRSIDFKDITRVES